ncbi:MAG: mycofactocin dehydrogenase MftG [Chloroflexota bacterium]
MQYDHIILGAGSAGAILAGRLSEDPERSVLLIEAGPDYANLAHLPEEVKLGYATGSDVITSSHNWDYVARGTASAPMIPIPRGKVTGGSSAINGQVCLRGVPEDYNLWASKGNDEWEYERCVDSFTKLEADLEFGDRPIHGSSGPIVIRRFKREEWDVAQKAFHAACLDAGFADVADHNDPNATGVGPIPLNNAGGIRLSTAMGYLNPARHRLNLTVRAQCTVTRLLFDGVRCTGAAVESGGERFTVHGNEVILSAGAVASPHLLMVSGVGPRDHLEAFGILLVRHVPGVGQNLRDHPMLFVTWRTKPEHRLDAYAPRIQVVLRWTAKDSPLWNDLMLFMSSFAPRRVGRRSDRMVPVGIRMHPVLDLAVSVGEVRLQSADPAVQPLLDYRYFEHEFDRRRMREIVRLAVQLAEHADLRALIAERIEPTDDELASDDGLDEFIQREVTTGHHSCGTCKMGPASDPLAVVDQRGKVHGLQNLRVVDASVMPDCIRANTNLTTMMIAERVADFIRRGA